MKLSTWLKQLHFQIRLRNKLKNKLKNKLHQLLTYVKLEKLIFNISFDLYLTVLEPLDWLSQNKSKVVKLRILFIEVNRRIQLNFYIFQT